jgi:hypothetical protein
LLSEKHIIIEERIAKIYNAAQYIDTIGDKNEADLIVYFSLGDVLFMMLEKQAPEYSQLIFYDQSKADDITVLNQELSAMQKADVYENYVVPLLNEFKQPRKDDEVIYKRIHANNNEYHSIPIPVRRKIIKQIGSNIIAINKEFPYRYFHSKEFNVEATKPKQKAVQTGVNWSISRNIIYCNLCEFLNYYTEGDFVLIVSIIHN